MKIKKIRIKNFRSIQDSGDIYLEDKVTILAGKNESGKTAILEAVEDFDANREIRKEARPIYDEELIPQVEITFSLSSEEITSLLQDAGIEAQEKRSKEINVIKIFPKSYSLDSASTDWLNKLLGTRVNNLKKQIKNKIGKVDSVLSKEGVEEVETPQLNFDDIEGLGTTITNFKTQLTPHIAKVEDEKTQNKLSQRIEEAIQLAEQVKQTTSTIDKFIADLVKTIPNFIYFDSFENMLPFQIPLSGAKKNKGVLNFAKIANIDLDLLLDPSRGRQTKMNYLGKKSTTITGDFLDYWNQDKVKMRAILDGENLGFGFVEGGKSETFSMEQRSKGFQWFLSFYIQLKLYHEQEEQNYLLVDEPGLYLHAKAQRDVLSVLEERSNKMPVIFSTHSPYLLEADKLDRVRLVFRDKEDGTIVESKIHKVSDKETLTPILTAIGLEITSGIVNPDKFDNVIVEGPSDWYYFTAFKKIFKASGLNFIYGGGAGNMPQVGTILHGWGCKVLYLYDNDKGKKDAERNLTRKWLVDKALIKPISDKEDTRIEDLFTKDDFKKFVLRDELRKYKTSNSEYIKKSKEDKVLLAKLFMADVEKPTGKMSQETIKNFRKVFEVLRQEFNRIK